MSETILVTGFGAFLDVAVNASGELARCLDGEVLGDARVHSAVMPVAFERLAPSYAAALDGLEGESPIALLSMGVHRDGFFRMESQARAQLDSDKPDVDGVFAKELSPLGAEDLASELEFDGLRRALQAGGASDVRLSENAGGYVCERCYFEVLKQARRLEVPGFFLHVPPLALMPLEEQLGPVRSLIAELARQAAE